MGENKKKVINIVIDTNVIISSLIKREGITRAALVLLSKTPHVHLLTPRIFQQEIKRHIREISIKAKLDQKLLSIFLNEITNMIKVVDEERFKEYMKEARNLVSDEKDTSFVALALKYRPSIIMTYNKTDYKKDELEKEDIKVRTPAETLEELGIDVKFAGTKLKRKHGLIELLSKLVALFKANNVKKY